MITIFMKPNHLHIWRIARHALLALAASVYAASGYAGDGASMMPDTQTYCFGRFLIDLPKSAQLISQTSEFMFGEIKSERFPKGQEAFAQKMKEREIELRIAAKTASKAEYKYITTHLSNRQDARIFVTSWTGYGHTGAGFELYRYSPGVLFSMKGEAFDPTSFNSVLQDMETKFISNLRVRKPNEIPGESGFCIKDGFIADDGQTPQYEYAKLSFRFKEWPDVNVEVSATRGGKLGPSLLERVNNRKIPAIFAEAAKEVKTLRKGNHDVGPLQGEEILEAFPTDDGYLTHHFVWDTQGKLDSATEPAFYFEFQTGFVVGSNNPDVPPSLTDKQAIELFDAIVNSIRLRPTTPGKTSAAEPHPSDDSSATNRLPLGTKVSSLRACPETGLYECPSDTPGVAERRAFIEQGRPMPGAFIAQSKRGITGLLGGQESKEVETFWTLVAYGSGTS